MRPSSHILVVDDDAETRQLLAGFLTRHGYRVSSARDGVEMHRRLGEGRFDLIVLDVMLPGEDGLTLCRELRTGSYIPIIMLTAMGEDLERIIGLEMGADDYMPKPFNPHELRARIKAVLRRCAAIPPRDGPSGTEALCFAGWRLELNLRRLIAPSGRVHELSAGEFDLLRAFLEHPQRALSRDQLLDLARGRDAVPFDRSVDVQVSRLRRRLATEPEGKALIKTVHRVGYVFTAAVTAACGG